MDQQIEQKIVERGQEFFNSISGEAPSIFNKGWWTGKVMDWSMKNEDFKVQLFRFVDVLPYLNTSESLLRHIREYFASSGSEVPSVLRWGAGKAGLGGALTAKIMGGAIRSNIESMGRQFIIGQNVKEAMGGLAKLRKDGFAFTVDLLGEASVNEEESDAYAAGYHEVLDALAEEQKKWPALSGNGPDDGMDWGSMPKVNISIKPSALYSRANPVALEDSVEGIYRRLAPLYQKTIDMGGFMCIDMEQLKYREITVELFKRLRSAPEFRHYPHLCLVQQAYLKDTEQAVRDLIAWARKEKLPIALRLVKGAYWDAETVFAKQCDWPVPVWTHKPESDLAHEKISRLILENHDIVYFACASHNVRSIAAVMEYARQLDVPEERYEFQVLYGMAEPVRKGLRNVAGRVRLYCPYGKLIPGMAYLVRRLLENGANTSFVNRIADTSLPLDELVADPVTAVEKLAQQEGQTGLPHPKIPLPRDLYGHGRDNSAGLDLANEHRLASLSSALLNSALQKWQALPMLEQSVAAGEMSPVINPAEPKDIVGYVREATPREVEQALESAVNNAPIWFATPPAERAAILHRAAVLMESQMQQLIGILVREAGKTFSNAIAEVREAVDFLHYYAGQVRDDFANETHRPLGPVVCISPWNFPLAIFTGQIAAALAAGNSVLAKPAEQTPLIAAQGIAILLEAGVPPGVVQLLPGRGETVGAQLTGDERVRGVMFTGSTEVATLLQRNIASRLDAQGRPIPLIAETGGMNAMIVDSSDRTSRNRCAGLGVRQCRSALFGTARAVPAR